MIKELLCGILSLYCLSAGANLVQATDTLTVELHYRQGAYRLDSNYMDNRKRIDSLRRTLHALSSDTTFRLDGINIVSSASPEGSISFNRTLSQKRTRNMSDYLRRQWPSSLVQLLGERHIGVDWKGLQTRVEQSDMPYKEEVLRIIRNTPELVVRNGVVVDSRKRQLMNLRRGTCWRYMERAFFPELRRSFIEVEYSAIPQPYVPEAVPDTTASTGPEYPVHDGKEDTRQDSVIQLTVQPLPPFYMAVKTNLLYDALLVPNIGVEFYLGKGFSIGADWMYAWWNKNSRHRFWRIYGGELAVRKYFGRASVKPLQGHHLGIYGQIFTYDFETGGRGYIGGKPGRTLWENMNYAAGVEYGYSLPVARRLNLDFVIGAGYWGGTYYEYIPIDNHYVWQQTNKRHWWGPTKAEVSLVWLLGRGNYNARKGGKQ